MCFFYALLVSSKCRVRSRKIINTHNGRVSVELGLGKSFNTIATHLLGNNLFENNSACLENSVHFLSTWLFSPTLLIFKLP